MNNKEENSKCCGAKVTVEGGDEGTMHWECSECKHPCDLRAVDNKEE